MLGVQVMATINPQGNSLSQTHSSVYFRLKTVAIMLRHISEKQVWLKSIKKCQSKLLGTKREFKEKLLGFMQAPASPQKCMMKMKESRNKETMTVKDLIQ